MNQIITEKRYSNLEQPAKLKEMIVGATRKLNSRGIDINEELSKEKPLESVKRFNELNKDIENSLKGYISGNKGEEDTYDALKILEPDVKILKNIQTPSYDPSYSVEHDMIVISQKGIFTIEIKNISTAKACITKQGRLISVNANGKILDKGNVAQQTKWHKSSISHLLKGTKYENTRIVPLLLFSNDYCNIENNFTNEFGQPFIKECYRNTAEYMIFNEIYNDCLTMEDMIEIEKLLKDANSKYEPRKYPLIVSPKVYENAVDVLISDVLKQREVDRKIEKIGNCIYTVRFLAGLLENGF